jgi:DNA polymerase I
MFYQRDNATYCLQPSCSGCPHDSHCQREEMSILIGPGVNIRQSFRARPGHKWVSIDFSGIELRFAAQLSGEPVWVNAFLNDHDLHMEMARVMFKKDEPTDYDRKIAKMGNFGNLYLASIDTFHNLTDLTYNEAAIAWKKWWAAIPVYADFVERQKALYRSQGRVRTFFGRIREMRAMIAEAESREKEGKRGGKKTGWGFCDRTAVNTVIQGASADLLKIAMNRVTHFLEREKLENDVKMMLTVHDELDFEVKEQSTPVHTYAILREIERQMTMTPKGSKLPEIQGFRVPLKVETEIGDSWGSMEKLDDLDPENKITFRTEPTHHHGKSPTKSISHDEAVLQITSLREEDAPRVHLAIFKAANQEGVVKVPLKFQMGQHIYQSGTLNKVSSDYLRRELEGIPGVWLRD